MKSVASGKAQRHAETAGNESGRTLPLSSDRYRTLVTRRRRTAQLVVRFIVCGVGTGREDGADEKGAVFMFLCFPQCSSRQVC